MTVRSSVVGNGSRLFSSGLDVGVTVARRVIVPFDVRLFFVLLRLFDDDLRLLGAVRRKGKKNQ